MPYPIIECEVSEPLPAVSFTEADTGVAIVLRRNGKPVAFWMERLPVGRVLGAGDLARRIYAKASAKLLGEAIRDEITTSAAAGPVPSVTIAICTKDRPDNLGRCLGSLRACLATATGNGAAVEVLVVDNASTDERTRQLVSSLPDLRYVYEPKPGLNFARNRALGEATGELLAFLDDDVTVDRGWLAGLLEAATAAPDAAAFTGLVLPYELATEAQILFEQRGGFRRGFERVRYGQTRRGDALYPSEAWMFGTGANMAFRRQVLNRLGGFDEALDAGAPLPGGGDLDIFYRFIRGGHTLVYEPSYLVFHQHRRELAALRRQYGKSWGTGFMAYVVKSYRSDPARRRMFLRLIAWWFLNDLWQLQKSLVGRHVLPPSMVLAELWGGVVGLLGEYSRSSKRIAQIRRDEA